MTDDQPAEEQIPSTRQAGPNGKDRTLLALAVVLPIVGCGVALAVLSCTLAEALSDAWRDAVGIVGLALGLAAVVIAFVIFLRQQTGDRDAEGRQRELLERIAARQNNTNIQLKTQSEQMSTLLAAVRSDDDFAEETRAAIGVGEIRRVGNEQYVVLLRHQVPLALVRDLVEGWEKEQVTMKSIGGEWYVQNLLAAWKRVGLAGNFPWVFKFRRPDGAIEYVKLSRVNGGPMARSEQEPKPILI